METVDLDGDGALDLVLDEGRLPCQGVRPGAFCPEVGCSIDVTLNDGGRWRPALDVVGGYCLDRTADPPHLITIQEQFVAGQRSYTLNVRYSFSRGMALQSGRGRC